MIGTCSTGKRAFFDEEAAIEALIQSKIDHHHKIDQGAINVYRCEFCNEWHLTSKGELHKVLNEPQVLSRIKRGQTGRYWEEKYRR